MIKMSVLDYRIRNDSSQIILSKVLRDKEGNIKVKDGAEVTRTVGYHGSLEHALRAIRRDHVFTCPKEITTVDELQIELNHVLDSFNKAIKLNEGY